MLKSRAGEAGRLLPMKVLIVTFVMAVSALLSPPAWSWDYSKHSIPIEDILSGGPPKDGIPALTDPAFVAVGDADFMREEERVLGVFRNGIARAYPLRILSWHELVNDRFGDLPVLVSW